MRWASPSTIAVFPTPAGPSSTGLRFALRTSTSIIQAVSSLPADHRAEQPVRGELREIAPELVEQWRRTGAGRGSRLDGYPMSRRHLSVVAETAADGVAAKRRCRGAVRSPLFLRDLPRSAGRGSAAARRPRDPDRRLAAGALTGGPGATARNVGPVPTTRRPSVDAFPFDGRALRRPSGSQPAPRLDRHGRIDRCAGLPERQRSRSCPSASSWNGLTANFSARNRPFASSLSESWRAMSSATSARRRSIRSSSSRRTSCGVRPFVDRPPLGHHSWHPRGRSRRHRGGTSEPSGGSGRRSGPPHRSAPSASERSEDRRLDPHRLRIQVVGDPAADSLS